jgi:hypothetical protein
MELQLRPPVYRFHPLMRPRRGFAGLGADPGINKTTMWTPSGGFVGSGGGAPAAVYQAPAVVPNPACSNDPNPYVSSSPACVDQLQKVQQQRFQLANNANFQVDYTNCVGQGLDPATCAARTYGLTPAGGYTSDAGAGPGGSQAILDSSGNVVTGVPVYTGPPLPGMPGSGTGAGSGSAPPVTVPSSIKFTNLTSGNAAVLNVGDRWQIQISNAAKNAPVSVTGGQNGAHDTTPMGSTDSNGGWTSNGQITADQIGSWTEAWTVGGQPVGNFAFTVPGGTAGSSSTSGQTVTGSFADLLNKSVTVGGTSIPDWALIGAGLVVVFLLMRK